LKIMLLVSEKKAKIEDHVVMKENVNVGYDSIIGAHTTLMKNVEIGNRTIIGPMNVIESGAKIGDNCTLQPFCVIAKDTIIEDNVFIGPHFSCANDKIISKGEHGTSPAKHDWKPYPIKIEKGATLGTRVTIAPGVTIGSNARIDMCSFILHDVPANAHIRPRHDIAAVHWREGCKCYKCKN